MKNANTSKVAGKPMAVKRADRRSKEPEKSVLQGGKPGSRRGAGRLPLPDIALSSEAGVLPPNSRRIVGIDLGDRQSHYCTMSMSSGTILERGSFPTTSIGLQKQFGGQLSLRIVIEAGTHSPWISRLLESMGHEVLVGNPSRMVLGGRHRRKTDRIDAEQLARIGRVDPALLYPIRHRSASAQADISRLRARDVLVRTRTSLINHARGIVKSAGGRLPACSAEAFAAKAEAHVPEPLAEALAPILTSIADLTKKIRAIEKDIERIARDRYPETALLTAIRGVGALTALAFVLTLEDPNRFRTSRVAGAYVGLVPRVHQSGDSSPELRITKTGNGFLRRLLVQSGHYLLGPFGEDCDLRRFGLRLAERGGKKTKKRAVVAVARKLAVLMHRLWSRGEVYDPLYEAKKHAPATETVAA